MENAARAGIPTGAGRRWIAADPFGAVRFGVVVRGASG